MSQGANVDDLDVFRVVKAALLKFRGSADSALLNADSEVARTKAWLEGEQLAYWQVQIRKRTEAVGRAKEAIRQKQIFKDSSGRTPSTFHEEKILRAAIAALEHAEARLVRTKKSVPVLEKQFENYRSGVQGLGSLLVSEFPKAVAALERMATTLDEYVTLASSAPAVEGAAATPLDTSSDMHRGGESAEQATPSSSPAPPETKKGADDVPG